jgi:hypothetical protein
MNQVSVRKKLRGFVVDAKTGLPLPNVPLFFEAEKKDGDQIYRWSLGLLVTDQAGYASFDLGSLTPTTTPQSIRITPTGEEQAATVIKLAGIDFSLPIANFLIKANREKVKNTATTRLPSIQNPDNIDREISPYSFSVKTDIHLGEGNCQTPIPTTFPLREFRIGRIVVTSDLSPAKLNADNQDDGFSMESH